MRFVIDVAKEYSTCGLSLAELISAGNIGLMEAARRFDETRGFKFITYAVMWIRQYILHEIKDQSVVRKPSSVFVDSILVNKAMSDLETILERSPSFDEILDRVNISKKRIFSALGYRNNESSLDAPWPGYDEDEGSEPRYSCFEDSTFSSPDNGVQRLEQEEKINSLLGPLNDRERKIIKIYFGLGGYKPMNLEQMGVIFKLTRERVRQLRNRALEKMKENAGVLFEDILTEG